MADPQYCFLYLDTWWSCLTKAEWAAWTTFGATLLGGVGAVGAVYVAARVARTQSMLAEQNRRADARDDRLRSLTICCEAVKEAKATAALALETRRNSAVFDVGAAARFQALEKTLAECLKDRVAIDAIGPITKARQATSALIRLFYDSVLERPQFEAQWVVFFHELKNAGDTLEALRETVTLEVAGATRSTGAS